MNHAFQPQAAQVNEGWRDQALCAQIGFVDFHPDKHARNMERTNIAKRICSMCDVQQECLEYSLLVGDDHGIWGGLSPRERQKLRRKRGVQKPEKNWHGTARGARRHREDGERPCLLCLKTESEQSRLSKERTRRRRGESA
jgi:WhiB family redox-sensing transcriptional regulator